jgi:hypothetical protein
MSRLTADEAFSTWQENDEDLCDVAHIHFEALGFRDWPDVSHEAERLYSLAFGEPEFDGVAVGCISGAAAGGYHAAMKKIAAMLGVDAHDLSLAASSWAEAKIPPPPIDPAALHAFVKAERESFEAFRAGRRKEGY